MKIPVLMYHKVGADVNSKEDTFLNVSTSNFQKQLKALKFLGYTGITFADAVLGLEGKLKLPRKPVCITFDDGYVNVLENAAPALKQLRWPATVFIPTDYVGDVNRWDFANGKPTLPIMNWDQLRALQAEGWEIAGHTVTHPHLEQLNDNEAREEMLGGKLAIENELGNQERTFCYPYGGHNSRTAQLCKEVGFIAACTTKSGLASGSTDRFLLPRVKIAYRDGLPGFLYRLVLRPLL